MSDTVIYEVFYNRDLTEGRGPMGRMGFYRTEAEVDKAVADKSYWIMGVTHNHEVYEIRVTEDNSTPVEYVKVFGHRNLDHLPLNVRRQHSNYGWLDYRDIEQPDDPDYKQYLRLREKFEG